MDAQQPDVDVFVACAFCLYIRIKNKDKDNMWENRKAEKMQNPKSTPGERYDFSD